MLDCRLSFKAYAKNVRERERERERAIKRSLKTAEVLLDADKHVLT